MKKSIWAFTIIGLTAGALLTGCGKKSEKIGEQAQEAAGDAVQVAKDAGAALQAEWLVFKGDAEKTIEANKKMIDEFNAKMEKAGPKTKAKYSQEVAALEQKNNDLKKMLEEYKDEGQDKWEAFKKNFQHDMDGLGTALKDLFKDNS